MELNKKQIKDISKQVTEMLNNIAIQKEKKEESRSIKKYINSIKKFHDKEKNNMDYIGDFLIDNDNYMNISSIDIIKDYDPVFYNNLQDLKRFVEDTFKSK